MAGYLLPSRLPPWAHRAKALLSLGWSARTGERSSADGRVWKKVVEGSNSSMGSNLPPLRKALPLWNHQPKANSYLFSALATPPSKRMGEGRQEAPGMGQRSDNRRNRQRWQRGTLQPETKALSLISVDFC